MKFVACYLIIIAPVKMTNLTLLSVVVSVFIRSFHHCLHPFIPKNCLWNYSTVYRYHLTRRTGWFSQNLFARIFHEFVICDPFCFCLKPIFHRILTISIGGCKLFRYTGRYSHQKFRSFDRRISNKGTHEFTKIRLWINFLKAALYVCVRICLIQVFWLNIDVFDFFV